MKVDTLEALFEDEIKDLYSAENQIIKALPRMAKLATTEELRKAFEDHLDQTRGHAQRLVQIGEQFEHQGQGKSGGMEGLLEEGKEIMSEAEEPVMDAALIGAAQKVEHLIVDCLIWHRRRARRAARLRRGHLTSACDPERRRGSRSVADFRSPKIR